MYHKSLFTRRRLLGGVDGLFHQGQQSSSFFRCQTRQQALHLFSAKGARPLVQILAFESGKTYCLPTPYNSYGAAAILAEAMVTYQEESNRDPLGR